jgi:hypothetical protein
MPTKIKLSSVKRSVVLAALAVASAFIAAAPAAADHIPLSALHDPTPCVGALSGPHDNVVVPPGTSCVVGPGTTIKGNIKNFGDLLVFGPGTTIGGSVDSEPGNDTDLIGNGLAGITVGGDVHVKGAIPLGADVELNQVDLHGNFWFEENDSTLRIIFNEIGGNVKAEKNTRPGTISNNVVGGNIECKENTPGIVAFANTVGGQQKCPET